MFNKHALISVSNLGVSHDVFPAIREAEELYQKHPCIPLEVDLDSSFNLIHNG